MSGQPDTDQLSFAEVTPVDGTARASALAALGAGDTFTRPPDAVDLGKLGTAAAWVAGCQGYYPPRALTRPRVVVFAADHGVAERGVSARPAGSTGAVVAEVEDGSSPLAVTADAVGAGLRVIGVGLAEGASDYLVRRSSGVIDVADALTDDEVRAGVRAGMAVADVEVDSGADLLIAANLGVGSTTAASTLVAALTGSEPVAVVGRGSGIDDAGWMRKTIAVRDALRRARPHLAEPLALLRTAGGADLAALAGFLAQAAVRRTPVLLAGLTVSAAAMVAEELAPGARQWWLAVTSTEEPAHRLALEHLDLEPLLDLGVNGDAELAAVAAVPVIATATRVLAATA
ncbi:MAG: nicotinate-nucleotide--dimethylbenzimidazole phosphoribosyltransferase [Actinophytocola sp.]|nr:nicotinate-nucleotide--dimethylbenzimidazole phosphoribosyltransferase [Actinophytocola sp.]